MQKFDAKFGDDGKMLIPKNVRESFRGKDVVMVFDEGEIRIMPKVKFKNVFY